MESKWIEVILEVRKQGRPERGRGVEKLRSWSVEMPHPIFACGPGL